ncbi:DUF4309 domain-containing protein [Rossellomorea sp. LjRoot5]|uniref:DUF4309 domain-containing protein n=1 Tax=Rossellomorea sp. LjRoot5 TaxID=3342331 RepID=UPI003ECD64B9
MKRFISTITLIFIMAGIVGCQSNNTETKTEETSSTPDIAKASKNDPTLLKKEKKSDREWIDESKADGFLSNVGIEGPVQYIVHDLDNDTLPEVIAYYGPFSEQLTENIHGLTIFKQDDSSRAWKKAGEYKDDLVNDFQLHGVIENTKKEKFLVGSQTVASATNMYSALKIFKYNPSNQEIRSVSTIAISNENPYKVQMNKNAFSLQILDDNGNVQTEELWEFESDWILKTQNRTVMLMDTEQYFDKAFKEELTKGRLKGIPYPLGTNIQQIKNELGTPDVEEYYQGAPTFGYKDSNLFFSHLMNEEQLVSILYNVNNTPQTFKDLESLLGTPQYAGIDEMSGLYTQIYSIDNKYVLIGEGYTHTKDSGIARIQYKSQIE